MKYANTWTSLVSFLVLSHGFSGLAAQAQPKICVPLGPGVPWLSGPPQWWNASMNGRFNDPRWNRAASVGGGVGGSGDVDFRALYSAGKLYLSWEVKFDPGGLQGGTTAALNGDAIVIGIKTGTETARIRVVLQSPPAFQEQAVIASETRRDIKVEEWHAVNGWVDPTSAWFEHPAVWDSMVTNDEGWWAFAIVLSSKIGTTTAYQDGDILYMWYTYVVNTDPSVPTVVQYHFPWTRMQDFDATLGDAPQPDDNPVGSLNWGEFTVKTVTTGCAGDVALDRAQIGTIEPTFTTPSSEIKLTSPNQFVARPTNLHLLGEADLTAHSITARFYLANWGSVPDAFTNWKEISPTPHRDNDADIVAPQTAHGHQTDPGRNDIHFDWTVPPADRCRYDPTCGGRKHQCVLVELSGAQYVFVNKSVYRNMDFVPGSRFEREAEINIVGLQALAGRPTRDVYLYLETLNMPSITDGALDGQTLVVADTLFSAAGDTSAIRGRPKVRSDTISLPSGDQGGRTQVLNAALAQGLLGEREIDPLMPTYRVHVYHATGDSFTVGGKKAPILRAQSSFGYWVDHKGSLGGWSAKLTGAGLEHLSGRWYRLAVPHDSFAVVNTIIEAIEVQPYAVSVHGGLSVPAGDLKNAVNSGFGFTVDLERRLNHTFSLAALYGFHRFEDIATSGNVDARHISGSLQMTIGSGAIRLMLDGGGGSYTFKPGGTDGGIHAGAGVTLELSPYVGLSAHARAHKVYTSGSDTRFYAIQIGGRFRF